MNIWRGGFNRVKTGILLAAGLFLLCSLGFGLLLPESPPSFKGGPVSAGTSGTWVNDSGQSIYDCLVKAKDSNGEPLDASNFGISIAVNGDPVAWSTINAFGGSDWKKKVTQDEALSCGAGDQITVSTGDPAASLDIQFTNENGAVVGTPSKLYTVSPTDIHSIPAFDAARNDRWSLCLENKHDGLIVGFTFTETPTPLVMTELNSTKLGTTDPGKKTVSFEFPMAPKAGKVVINAKYAMPPAQDSQVRCTPIISKVIPRSVKPRQSFGAGTGVSVPDIILKEVEAGVIRTTAEQTEIVLTPRDGFEFASVGNASVTSGNLQLGTPYITQGEIHIEIFALSYGDGKSSIRLNNITINTLSGLSEGTVSVRQAEPGGNDSNFHYAYFNPKAME